MLYRSNKEMLMFAQDNKGIAQMVDGTLHILNSTAYEIYSICDGKTEQEIVDIIKSNYNDVNYEIIYADVKDILKSMVEKEIVSVEDEA